MKFMVVKRTVSTQSSKFRAIPDSLPTHEKFRNHTKHLAVQKLALPF
jgi:hypothetical protein